MQGNYSEECKQKRIFPSLEFTMIMVKNLKTLTFHLFFDKHGIHKKFSTLITRQQNGIIERKNRAIQKMAQTMLNSMKVVLYFLREVVNIVYIF